MKPLFAIALACVLLACPLHCAIGGCQDVALSEVGASHCQCCLPLQAPEQEGVPMPALPVSNCDCENCMCDGAIPVGTNYRNHGLTSLSLDIAPATVGWAAQPPALPTSNRRFDASIPIRILGNNARAAFSCWII